MQLPIPKELAIVVYIMVIQKNDAETFKISCLYNL